MANPFYDKMPTGELLSKLLALGMDVQSMNNIIATVAQNFQMYLWLTAPLTVYVSPSGTDTTTDSQGLSVDKPFKTLQYALNFVSSKYNFNQYNVTIQLADGSYNTTGNTVIPSFVSTTGVLIITGNSGNNTLVKVGTITNNSRCLCHLKNLTIIPSEVSGGAYHGLISALAGTYMAVYNCRMVMPSNVTTVPIYGVCIWSGGSISLTGTSKFEFVVDNTSRIGAFIYASSNSLFDIVQDVVVTGSTQMWQFIQAELSGTVNSWANPDTIGRAPKFTATGTLTGLRYNVTGNSVLRAAIGTATADTIFPGTIAGVSSSGGQYIPQ